jgi:hypothetical protein
VIKHLLVRFEGMEIGCLCEVGDPKCDCEDCKEYVVKFTEVKRSKPLEVVKKKASVLNSELKKVERELKRKTTELEKSLKSVKNFRL